MRVASVVLVLSFVVAGCGGGKKSSTTGEVTGGEGGGGGETEGEENTATGDMFSQELLDSVQQNLMRRRTAAARCLVEAVNAGKAERNSRGAVALSFVIGTNGKARNVTVTKSSINNETVEACVIAKVEEIDFGDVPSDLEWSHTYAFESM